ncbi:hypothetical protein Ddc_05803 [Ditylenchus destructor]|nr:hypothetical protein Ddc_05803 [Ditylenchus destructor]
MKPRSSCIRMSFNVANRPNCTNLSSSWITNVRIFCIYLAILFIATVDCRDVKVFKRGKIELVDETQFKLADDYEADFSDDLKKPADLEDAYDEIVPYLPKFEVHKNGENIGFTRIKIVTRQQSTWSTPLPRTRKGQYKTWGTPKLEAITIPSPLDTTTKKPKTLSTSPKPTTAATKIDESDTLLLPPLVEESAQENSGKSFKSRSKPKKAEEKEIRKSDANNRNGNSVLVEKFDEQPLPRKAANRFFGEESPSTTTPKTTTKFASTGTMRHRLASRPPNLEMSLPDAEQPTQRPQMRQMEQHVKSNSFMFMQHATSNKDEEQVVVGTRLDTRPNSRKPIKITPSPSVVTQKTPTSTTQGSRSWSRSWSFSPNGTLIMKTWDSAVDSGRPQVEVVTGAPTAAVKTSTNGARKATQISTPASKATTSRIVKVPHKPALISSAGQPYRGPTFNCRILDAAVDGQPTAYTDPTCNLSYPGFSSDGSCKCTYEVNGRDENGCATGFLYTCVHDQPLVHKRVAAA